MVLFLTALAPINGRWREKTLAVAAFPVSGAQCITIIVLLAQKMLKSPERFPSNQDQP
jgi:hypothetical protein